MLSLFVYGLRFSLLHLDGSGGVAVGTVYNHKTALDSDTFMFAKKLLSKEYLEI